MLRKNAMKLVLFMALISFSSCGLFKKCGDCPSFSKQNMKPSNLACR